MKVIVGAMSKEEGKPPIGANVECNCAVAESGGIEEEVIESDGGVGAGRRRAIRVESWTNGSELRRRCKTPRPGIAAQQQSWARSWRLSHFARRHTAVCAHQSRRAKTWSSKKSLFFSCTTSVAFQPGYRHRERKRLEPKKRMKEAERLQYGRN